MTLYLNSVLNPFLNSNESWCNTVKGMSETIHHESAQILNVIEKRHVYCFLVNDHKIHFVPHGISNFFPGLKILQISKCSLKKISVEDMKNFTSLSILDLSGNEIHELRENTFQYNMFLKLLNLSNNRIRIVEYNVLTSMKNLEEFNFENNDCYSCSANSTENMREIIYTVQNECINKSFINFEVTGKVEPIIESKKGDKSESKGHHHNEHSGYPNEIEHIESNFDFNVLEKVLQEKLESRVKILTKQLQEQMQMHTEEIIKKKLENYEKILIEKITSSKPCISDARFTTVNLIHIIVIITSTAVLFYLKNPFKIIRVSKKYNEIMEMNADSALPSINHEISFNHSAYNSHIYENCENHIYENVGFDHENNRNEIKRRNSVGTKSGYVNWWNGNLQNINVNE